MHTAAEKELFRKKMDELIRIGLKGDQESFKKIPRSRLTVNNINRVFNVDADYLIDDTNEVIYPKQWMYECVPYSKSLPVTYFVVEKIKRVVYVDPEEDDHYEGESQICVCNVNKSVTENDLIAWIRCGLSTEDPRLQDIELRVKKCEDRIKSIEQKIEEVPFRETKSDDFKEAAKERRQMAKYLNEERRGAEEKLEKLKEHLQQERIRKLNEEIQVKRIRVDGNLRTWYVYFPGPDGPLLEYQAVHKKNWCDVLLAIGDERRSVQRKPYCQTEGEFTPEHQKYAINMRNVLVVRRRHGKGALYYRDRSFYSGDWFEGKQHGEGEFFSDIGHFKGTFKHGRFHGYGEYKLANSERYDGSFKSTNQIEESLLNGGEYNDAHMHGKGKFTFADGSVYEGEFVRGRITGKGKYVSKDGGDVMEGDFVNGYLHGENCTKKTKEGVTYQGSFRNGYIEQVGKLSINNKYSYHGDFKHGLTHGRGVQRMNDNNQFDGFFQYGLPDGKIRVSYGNAFEEHELKTNKVILHRDWDYDGYLKNGQPRSRGMYTRRILPIKFFQTTNNRSPTWKYTYSIRKFLEKTVKKKAKKLRERFEVDAAERKKLTRFNTYYYVKGRTYIDLIEEEELRRMDKERRKIRKQREKNRLERLKLERIRDHQMQMYGKSSIEAQFAPPDELNPIIKVDREINLLKLYKKPPTKREVQFLIDAKERREERRRKKEEKERKKREEEEKKKGRFSLERLSNR
eukprot:g3972.t1